MPTGFLLADLAAEASGCTRCPLAATRTQVVFGGGDQDADLMVVGEAPGHSKVTKAAELGIPVVLAENFGQLLETGEIPS